MRIQDDTNKLHHYINSLENLILFIEQLISNPSRKWCFKYNQKISKSKEMIQALQLRIIDASIKNTNEIAHHRPIQYLPCSLIDIDCLDPEKVRRYLIIGVKKYIEDSAAKNKTVGFFQFMHPHGKKGLERAKEFLTKLFKSYSLVKIDQYYNEPMNGSGNNNPSSLKTIVKNIYNEILKNSSKYLVKIDLTQYSSNNLEYWRQYFNRQEKTAKACLQADVAKAAEAALDDIAASFVMMKQ